MSYHNWILEKEKDLRNPKCEGCGGSKLLSAVSSDDNLYISEKCINQNLIESTLILIKELTGLSLTLCDYFKGIKKNANGEKYFNIELKERISESKEYTKLLRVAERYNVIKVAPNGLSRVAIFPINIL